VDYEVMPYDPDLVLREDPDVVGLTAMTPTVDRAFEIGRRIKRVRPGLPVLLGGVHATLLPEETLRRADGSVDALVLGEGERHLPGLLERIGAGAPLEGLDGLAWREDSRIRVIPPADFIEDLDALPFPDRGRIRMELYRRPSSPGFSREDLRITELFTSRGCPCSCTFCAAPLLSGKRVRFRSVENVAAEMAQCMANHGIEHFTLNDDNFIAEEERVHGFCRTVRPLAVTWSCETRVNLATPEILRAMVEAGCRKVSFGVESGSPRILRKIKKGISLDRVAEAFHNARAAGLLRTGFFQVGTHPDETDDDIRLTWELIRRVDPDFIAVAIATPFPGTELHRTMKQQGLILNEDWSNYSHFPRHPSWRTHHFSPRKIVAVQKKLTRRFYLRPRSILRQLRSIRSLGQLRYQLSAGLSILKMVGPRGGNTPSPPGA